MVLKFVEAKFNEKCMRLSLVDCVFWNKKIPYSGPSLTCGTLNTIL